MAKGKAKVKVKHKSQNGAKKVTLKPHVKIILSSSKDRE